MVCHVARSCVVVVWREGAEDLVNVVAVGFTIIWEKSVDLVDGLFKLVVPVERVSCGGTESLFVQPLED